MGTVKIVSASAGSGKTYTLAYQYVRNVIANPALYKHILAVTFTNKATDEMKQRILSSINELAGGKDADGYRSRLRGDLGLDDNIITARAAEVRSKILHDYSHFSVLTIDKFFQRIVRSFLKELGININFNLELAEESLLSNAADRLLSDMGNNERIRSHVSAMVGERIDENRSWSIKREIERLGKQLFTEAYKNRSGSQQNGEEIEAAFENLTEKALQARKNIKLAAEKLLDFMNSYGLEPDDFPYKKNGAGSYAVKMASGSLKPHNSYVESAIGGKWTTGNSPKKALIESLAPQLTSMLGELVACHNNGIGIINTQVLVKENYDKFMMLSDLKCKIDDISREENILHISEVNTMLSKLVAGNDTPFIFEKAGNHFSHFMIDEFQDTSAMQWNNFIPLLQNSVAQTDGQPVLLVGDVKQSIYRWRGGDWSILSNRAAGEFRETSSESLQDNYRSRAEVVRFMNAIIGQCVAHDVENIAATLSEACTKGAISEELQADLSAMVNNAYSDYMQTVPQGKSGGYVTITSYSDNRDNGSEVSEIEDNRVDKIVITEKYGSNKPAAPTENYSCENSASGGLVHTAIETASADKRNKSVYVHPAIKMVEQLQARGYRAGDIAVLVRRNAEGSAMAQMLLEHKTNNPKSPYCYDVITHDALIIGRSPIVNFVISCLKISYEGGGSFASSEGNGKLSYSSEDYVSSTSVEDSKSFASTENDREVSSLASSEILSFPESNNKFLEDSNTVKSVKRVKRVSADSAATISLAQYNRWLGYDFDRPLPSDEEEFFARLRLLPPEEAFDQVVIHYGLSKHRDQISYLQALHQQIISFTTKKIADTPLFIKWWEETGSRESVSLPTDVNAITIDTIHRSKGLGYKAVIIPYCNWGMTTKPSTVIWAQAQDDSPAAALGKFPIGYKKDMAASHFSEEFYKEYVMSHIDNLNLFYVAVTRAKEELHIMIPQKEGRGTGSRETIDRFITASISVEESKVHLYSIESDTGEILDSIEGNISETGADMLFSFGQPVNNISAVGAASVFSTDIHEEDRKQAFDTGFTTNDISERIRLKLSHQRYFDEGEGRLAPRDYGVLMHEVFESATTLEEIHRNISLMEKNGRITGQEASELNRSLENAMNNETVRSWFDGQWNEVRNEAGIIVPDSGGYRPDRTMINGSRAVVVDYKFGRQERQKYVEQVAGYMSLLTTMGYVEVSGYVWYINLDKVVEVAAGQ